MNLTKKEVEYLASDVDSKILSKRLDHPNTIARLSGYVTKYKLDCPKLMKIYEERVQEAKEFPFISD